MADLQKIRQKSPALIAVLLAFVCLYLSIHTMTLGGENKKLQARAKTLETSITEAEKKTQELFEASQRFQSDKEAIQKELDAVKKEHEELKFEYQKVEEKLKAAGEEKNYLEEMLINKTKAIEALKKIPVNLGSVSSGSPEAASKEAPKETTKDIKKGRVLAVNEEHGFIVVDLGKADVKADTQFQVWRGNEIIATLTVLEVRDDMTACNIKDVKSGVKLQVNDSVVIP